jgi:Uma2 family endonuclease
MPSPFPGMNPYLENSELWPEVHHLLITTIMESLVPQLRPKYRVAIEKRVYSFAGENPILVGIPDVTVVRSRTQPPPRESNVAVAAPAETAVQVKVPVPLELREGYLEIRDMAKGNVIAVIEVLSPTNKRPGKGREMYLEKREVVLASHTHLIEIDLLREGEQMPVFENEYGANYRIMVSRGDTRPTADLYLFNLPNEIPKFALPLRSGDVEPVVDLQALLNGVYDRAGYDYTIDYSRDPVPALSEADAAWADAILREKGLR